MEVNGNNYNTKDVIKRVVISIIVAALLALSIIGVAYELHPALSAVMAILAIILFAKEYFVIRFLNRDTGIEYHSWNDDDD